MFAAGGRRVRGNATETDGTACAASAAPLDEAARKRAAMELVARHGEALKRTARRYSLCEQDAEDAYQRALEILLTKAPTDRPRELLAWTTTVAKHEALAVRRGRERLLGKLPPGGRRDEDGLGQVASPAAGPFERLERREDIARSREAIRALKPAERRALTLLAQGYSYAEIGEITGFSRTKINRCLAEGRERFRRVVQSSEDGSRCVEMRPLLSAFCDGEASPEESARAREHLRACARCRAVVRAYRTVPATIAALSPLPLVPAASAGAKGGMTSAASGGGLAGGAKGGGLAGLAKLAGIKEVLAVCAVAGTTTCVATGVVPLPDLPVDRTAVPRIERVAEPIVEGAPAAELDSGKRAKQDRGRARGAAEANGAAEEEAATAAQRAQVAAPAPEPAEATAPVEAPEPVEAAPAAPVESAEPATAPEAAGAAGEFGP
jgi:RNA polymerase sigma factor (sigma-70 family)